MIKIDAGLLLPIIFRLDGLSHLPIDFGQSPRASGRKLFGPVLKIRQELIVGI